MTVAQRTSATRMIADKGQTVTISGTSSATYNTATGATTATTYSATVKAVVLPLGSAGRFGNRKDGSSLAVAGDQNMIVAAVDTSGAVLATPPVDSIITLADGSKRTLVSVDALSPDGTSIIFDCLVRGAA